MSAENTKFYDLCRVAFTFLGIPFSEMGGYAEGEAVYSIKKMDPNFTWKRGADGSVARSKTYSKVYTVTIRFLQTAAANAILSGLIITDESANNGAGVGPIAMIDLGGQSGFKGSEAWIEGPPEEVEYGAQAGNLEYKIIVADGEMFLGGN